MLHVVKTYWSTGHIVQCCTRLSEWMDNDLAVRACAHVHSCVLVHEGIDQRDVIKGSLDLWCVCQAKSFSIPFFLYHTIPLPLLNKTPCWEPHLISQCLDSFQLDRQRGSCSSKCWVWLAFKSPAACGRTVRRHQRELSPAYYWLWREWHYSHREKAPLLS